MWDRERTRKFQKLLLDWYGRHRRELPWRSRPEPYRVWVSEIMLQQTQVGTVLPYFERFMERFPTVQTLASSTEQEVLSAWAGLGYYRRARNLLRAARMIVQEYGGVFPETLDRIMKLPGVGRYTAGAVASIAFNLPQPIVDGNVRRVVSRLHALDGGAPESFFWQQARAWIPAGSAADFNQAVMDLGALVCVHNAPLCLICPVSSLCEARRRGVQNQTPPLRRPRSAESARLVMLVLEKSGQLLLVRQRANSYVPGEWGLPTCELREGASPARAARDLAREIVSARLTLEARPAVKHGITYRRIVIHVFYGRVARARVEKAAEVRWLHRRALNRCLTSSAFHKAVRSALDGSARSASFRVRRRIGCRADK